jgi:signal transduction histidine kinase/CheY-like chemotaxis protein
LRAHDHELGRAHAELDRRVSERTAALEQVNERLRIEIAERRRAEAWRERALVEQRDTLAFLGTASERLAPVLTLDQLLDVLSALPLPPRVDWTMIHSVDDEGMLRSTPGMHRAPEKQPILAALAAAASGPPPDSGVLTQALASRKLTIASSQSDGLVAEFLCGTDVAPLLEELGTRSIAVIPLIVEGRISTAFSLVSAEEPFTDSDRIVFEDVEHRIRLVLDRVDLYRQTQEASRLKDEFLSTLSHELRTPLNAIFGWTRILRTRQLDEATAHALAVIDRNTEAQIKLIEEVLDVSRIITGKMTLTIESVDIRAILRATIDAARPGIEAKGIRLIEEATADIPAVFADPHRLQQVFWNLLSNASKFTPTEGVITVRLKGGPRFVEVEVADTGIGIRADTLPFVFDRFRQGDSSMTRRHGGLGLGLAIVRHIAELHGGTVKAESAGEGQGAAFILHLPADRRTRPAVAVHPDKTLVPPASLPLSGRAILVVEDHADARELIASVLEGAGARVRLAGSSEEALAHFSKERPDALVADIGLPGEDGYAMLGRIRALEGAAGSKMPAIALTAYARASDRERALAAGFQHHVVKPVDPQHLVSILSAALAR